MRAANAKRTGGNIKKASIKYIVVQECVTVYGVGHTPAEAIADACRWLDPCEQPDGEFRRYTPADVQAEIDSESIIGGYGDLELISRRNTVEFDSYLECHGGFEKRNGNWFAK